jgi:hypothetical protein
MEMVLMRIAVAPLLAGLALAACSPQPAQAPDVPEAPPEIAACNGLAPDAGRLVAVQDEAAAMLPAADMLRGGPIRPGAYDLVSAVRIGAATGWSGQQAVALGVAESEAGVELNWSSVGEDGARDSWTATLTDTPEVRLTYSCGRIGAVSGAFLAEPDALNLRLDDGANGALHTVFLRRG